VHVIEHATTDKVIDTGKPGDSTGDLLTWPRLRRDRFDRRGQRPEMHPDQPEAGTWECRWVTWLDGGSITVEGPFYDNKNSVIAITGGTGAYASATGDMQLVSQNGVAVYDFIFNLG
jgi:hypothetical protein